MTVTGAVAALTVESVSVLGSIGWMMTVLRILRAESGMRNAMERPPGHPAATTVRVEMAITARPSTWVRTSRHEAPPGSSVTTGGDV